MHALALLLAAGLATAPPPRAASRRAPLQAARPPENLLAGPARCVLHYLEAVRLAGPRRADAGAGDATRVDERAYARAKELTSPRTLQDIERRAVRGEDHPLAPWRDAVHARVLESFQLLSVRRAPRGAAVVFVAEAFRTAAPDAPLERTASEYLVARVHGRWRIVDRRPGGAFEDDVIAAGYAGYFDEPAPER